MKGARTKKELEAEDRHRIPLRITDTTLRDAHQSLWATRLRTADILPIIDLIDSVGYYSLEVWGGATFDVCLRFLRENPWERLRAIKAAAKKTPLQMLLRGQNLVGYRNYADDVVDHFVALACENGIDIFRVFDALNDTRNLEAAIRAVKKYGGHAQGTLAYTLSPVHTIERFVAYAKEQQAIGVDSICVKDMAGILSPIQAERLVTALIAETGLPVQLHCHASSGMATSTYVEGVRAGAGAIDCAISSVAGFSSQPPVEALATIFRETRYTADLDFAALERIAQYFWELAPSRRQSATPEPSIDPAILIHQIPGGMISNFRSQLAAQGALDKLPQVLEEVTRVRKDLGWPPLVTPTSQIVGTQAVMNILAGERYKITPNEVKNYLRGMYGRSPAPVDPALLRTVLGDEKPIAHRPADDLPPQLPNATEGIDPRLLESEEDILSYCILPEPALAYFTWRALPPEKRPPLPADLESSAAPRAASEEPAVPAASAADRLLSPEDYDGIQELLAKATGLGLDEITVRRGDLEVTMRASGTAPTDAPEPKPAPARQSKLTSRPAAAAAAEAPAAPGLTIDAPLVGTFYSSRGPGQPALVKVGDVVKAGDPVCIVEAMKLFNEIRAAETCRVLKFLAADGTAVKKHQPLVAIEKV